MIAVNVTVLLVVVVGLIYKYSVRHFNYWKERNVTGPTPLPFIGNIQDICTLKSSLGDFLNALYTSTDEPFLGFFIFDEPCLVINSPELIKYILIKDYNHFKDRTIAVPKHDETFARLLFVDKSPSWRRSRSKLSKKEVQNNFVDTFLRIVQEREDNKFQSDDFISTLTNLSKADSSFDQNQIAAQGIQFFIAGFETVASTIAFTLYEMAVNPDIQKQLRQEILSVIEESVDVNYDALKKMKFLDFCLMETLRKYPVLPFLDRRCDTDYNVPGTDLVIEKGTAIYIPIISIQRDEKYYEEPLKYNPNRFVKNVNEKHLIHVPFGNGPRFCLGKRFAEVVVKVALVHVLYNFEVEKVPETPQYVEFEPKNILLQSKAGLPIKFKQCLVSVHKS